MPCPFRSKLWQSSQNATFAPRQCLHLNRAAWPATPSTKTTSATITQPANLRNTLIFLKDCRRLEAVSRAGGKSIQRITFPAATGASPIARHALA